MKICDLTQSYAPKSGGIKTYIQEKQRFIKLNANHEHVLIIPGEIDSVERNENIAIYQIGALPLPHCESYRFIIRIDKAISILKTEKPDLIEFGSAYMLHNAGFFCKRHFHTSLVGFYHSDFPDTYIAKPLGRYFPPFVAQRAKEMAEHYARSIYSQCDATIVSSAVMEQKLMNLGIPRIHNIPLGVNPELFNPNKRDRKLRRHLGAMDDDILLIYAGRFDHEKRVEIIIEAFNRVHHNFNGRLIMVGDGPLKQILAEHCRNNAKIVIVPYQNDRAMLAKLLASADIYITAGPHETFGLSIIEAQASGLPLIGVRSGALLERVPESVGVLGSIDSVEDMAINILKLSTNGFRKKGQNARKLVEQKYSWNNTFVQLFAIYENLVGATKGNHAYNTFD